MAELIDLIEDAFSGNEEEPKQNNQVAATEEEVEEASVSASAPVVAPKEKRAPKVPKAKRPMEQVILVQPKTIKEWMEARAMFPADFSYTAEGDLQVPAIKRDVSRIIPVTRFQPATPEFTAEFYKTRYEQAKEQEEIYVQSKRTLKNIVLLYKNGEATVDEVLNANMEVATQENKLNEILKVPRKTAWASKVAESALTMNPYDKGTFPNSVVYTTYTTFPVQSIWMPAPEPEVAALQPLPIRQTEDSNSNSNNMPPPAPKKQLTAQQIAIIRARMGKK